MYDILELSKKLLPELKDIAKELKIKKAETLKKQDLIYKILDQQALESSENKGPARTESEITPSSEAVSSGEPASDPGTAESVNELNTDLSNESAEAAAIRRGKRPRTLKPVVKRTIESVMSVSPDGVKRPETRQGDWDQTKKDNRTDEKPDMFKKTDQPYDNRKGPKWRTDQKFEEKNERRDRFNASPVQRTEQPRIER